MEKTTQLLVLLLYSSFLTEGLRVRKKKVEINNNTSASDLSSEYETRGARFLNMLSLFTLVSFDNNDCTTSSGTQGIAKVIIKPSTSNICGSDIRKENLIFQAPVLLPMSALLRGERLMETVPRH